VLERNSKATNFPSIRFLPHDVSPLTVDVPRAFFLPPSPMLSELSEGCCRRSYVFSEGDWASCNQQFNYFSPLGFEEITAGLEWVNVRGFRSLHPGGGNFAMGDASVRFINEGVDHQLYRSLSTKDGGEMVEVP
jgi:prepilin-type processing-associated H-X9-DG protein